MSAEKVGEGVEHLTTSGQFQIDGNSFDVDNNVWIVGDSSEVVLLDAPHDAAAIKKAVGDRNVVAILCTHSHNDHVNAAPEAKTVTGWSDRERVSPVAIPHCQISSNTSFSSSTLSP